MGRPKKVETKEVEIHIPQFVIISSHELKEVKGDIQSIIPTSFERKRVGGRELYVAHEFIVLFK